MKIELESEKLLGYRLYCDDCTTGEKCGGKRGDKGGGGPIVRSPSPGGMAGGKPTVDGRTPGGMAGMKPRPGLK